MATAKTLLRRALENDEMFEFLEGRKDYHVDYSALAVNLHPTDFRLIVRTMNGANARKKEDLLIPEKLAEALRRCMAEDTLFDLYCAFSVVYYQLYAEAKGKASFELDRAVLAELREKLAERRDELKEYKDFEGYGQPNGVWSLVMAYNRKLRIELGEGLLAEKE